MSAEGALDIRIGQQAWALLKNQIFLIDWQELERRCPWATPYQSHHFVLTWLRHYGTFEPVVVALRGTDGSLEGLLVLGISSWDRRLVVAGGHQAEYQAWLATPEKSCDFIVRALSALDEVDRSSDLTFKYLPGGLALKDLFDRPLFHSRAGLLTHRRPLMRLDARQLQQSLHKKSNKSRWSRLQRLGTLGFTRITDPKAFDEAFDEIIVSYDARQNATKGVQPFAQDARKKSFHLDLMSKPGFLHVTATTLSGRLVAAHIGVIGQEAVHLSIVCHSELHAEHSPGKLHLLRLGELLVREGATVLDLTPGGDEWKERFANDHDTVHTLTVFRSPAAKRFRLLQLEALGVLKKTAQTVGVSPREARRALVGFKDRWMPNRSGT